METFEIVPVRVGEFLVMPKASLTYQVDFTTEMVAPVIMYLIKGRDKLVLVDTGGGDEEWAKKYHRPFRRPADEAPAAALKKIGVNVEDIELVVNTHLHWDHCFNNELFTKAKIYVQKLKFADGNFHGRCGNGGGDFYRHMGSPDSTSVLFLYQIQKQEDQ